MVGGGGKASPENVQSYEVFSWTASPSGNHKYTSSSGLSSRRDGQTDKCPLVHLCYSDCRSNRPSHLGALEVQHPGHPDGPDGGL